MSAEQVHQLVQENRAIRARYEEETKQLRKQHDEMVALMREHMSKLAVQPPSEERERRPGGREAADGTEIRMADGTLVQHRAATSATDLNRRFQYATFGGKPEEDWNAFRQSFQYTMTADHSTDEEARFTLMGRMRGEALVLVQRMSPRDFGTVTEMLDALEKVFTGNLNASLAESEYMESCQKADEQLQMWHARCLQLFRRAYPRRADDWREDKSLITKFSRGIINTKVCRAILYKQVEDYDQALDTAQAYLAAVFQESDEINRRKQRTHDPARRKAQASQQVGLNLTPVQVGVYGVQKPDETRADARTICQMCQRSGHTAPNCWTGGSGPRKTSPYRGNRGNRGFPPRKDARRNNGRGRDEQPRRRPDRREDRRPAGNGARRSATPGPHQRVAAIDVPLPDEEDPEGEDF